MLKKKKNTLHLGVVFPWVPTPYSIHQGMEWLNHDKTTSVPLRSDLGTVRKSGHHFPWASPVGSYQQPWLVSISKHLKVPSYPESLWARGFWRAESPGGDVGVSVPGPINDCSSYLTVLKECGSPSGKRFYLYHRFYGKVFQATVGLRRIARGSW